MTSGLTRVCVAFFGVLMCLWGLPAAAKPLSGEECSKLVSEHAELARKGIEERMDVDPTTAGEQLSKDELNEIERFLFVEGQIRFRCPEVQLAVPDPPKPTVPLPRRKPVPPTKRAG